MVQLVQSLNTDKVDVEIFVARELDTLFNGLTVTIIALEKKKLGIIDKVPDDMAEEFIDGVLALCKNMVGAGMVREIEERLRSYNR